MQRNSLILFALLSFSAIPAYAVDEKLAEQGHKLIKTYCHRCHGGGEQVVDGFDILNRENLLAKRGEDKLAYATAGKPAESLIWKKIDGKAMPPDDEPQPSDAEKEIIKKWIEAELPFPAVGDAPRTYKSERQVLSEIVPHLKGLRPEDRKFQRYFTFTHLYNNKAVSDEELRVHRAALSKVLNSLTWKPRIVPPTPLDPEQTILQIDIRTYGWDKVKSEDKKDFVWSDVAKAYPYALDYSDHREREMRRVWKEVTSLTSEVLWFRGDWFISTATKPPLYHVFLELPEKDTLLAKKLNVDIQADFNQNKLSRGGFGKSGVSKQNRLVDRHNTIYGHYWQSYDFKSNQGRANIFKFPLGPKFPGNKFDEFAFEHDGGEIIFNLPNGLQGYLLVNEKGDQIPTGPTAVVSDSKKSAGIVDVVNGISCMGCHVKGVVRFVDGVSEKVEKKARDKVQELYKTEAEMNKLLDKDEKRFLTALDLATGQFLRTETTAEKPIEDFEEVVSSVSVRYYRNLTPTEATLELPFATLPDDDLGKLARFSRPLANLGLGPDQLLRDKWHSIEDGESVFQKAANELELGVPFRKK